MNLENLLESIVSEPELHAKWLNTLSMMENCGARKISASEHKQDVNVVILKHAAEEARHAYYLKNQIKKTNFNGCQTYGMSELLAPIESFQYLNRLDTQISRYLKESYNFDGYKLKYASYLLTTFAIEVRADNLYPVYEEVLKKCKSSISVRMIIAEEKGHLEEMIEQMDRYFDDWRPHGEFAVNREEDLFKAWQNCLCSEVEKYHKILKSA